MLTDILHWLCMYVDWHSALAMYVYWVIFCTGYVCMLSDILHWLCMYVEWYSALSILLPLHVQLLPCGTHRCARRCHRGDCEQVAERVTVFHRPRSLVCAGLCDGTCSQCSLCMIIVLYLSSPPVHTVISGSELMLGANPPSCERSCPGSCCGVINSCPLSDLALQRGIDVRSKLRVLCICN